MLKTCVVLVNWNGGKDTVECLDSLFKSTTNDFFVVIVDNGSQDGSLDLISAWAARYQIRDASFTFLRTSSCQLSSGSPAKLNLIEAGSNIGFAAANNLAMKCCEIYADVEYYWILNNDTVVEERCLAIQVDNMVQDPSIGMLGARLMFYDNPDVVQGLAGGFLTTRARGYHIGLGENADSLPLRSGVESEMKYVLGASMFVRRSMVDLIGKMSEDYFLYFEEIDWAQRMPKSLRLAVDYNAVVWHKEGASIGSSTQSLPSATSVYYINAGLIRFYSKHYARFLPLAFGRVLRDAFGYVCKGEVALGCAALIALKDVALKKRRRGRYGSQEFRD